MAGGADDAEQKEDGSITTTSLDLELFNYDAGGPHQAVGLRFPALDVPRGADIRVAHLQFTAAETGADPTTITITGQAADNAPSFTTALNEITSRPTTAASVDWPAPPWTAGSSGPSEASADVSAIVEEIVGRDGWASGNALALILTGNGERVALSHDVSPASSTRLHLEYQISLGPATLESITVAPASATIEQGQTQQFSATGSYSDGGSQDLTSTATWTSSDTTAATIDSTGLASGLAPGAAGITAALDGVTSNTATLTVTTPPATLESITVAPASATIEQGQTQQFSATGSYSDGGSQDLTSTATWTSSDTTAATIDSTGSLPGWPPAPPASPPPWTA